jgi:hypothetical protein
MPALPDPHRTESPTGRPQRDGMVPHYQVRQARDQRNAAFAERNRVVAAFAHLMAALNPGGVHLVEPDPEAYPEDRKGKRREIVRSMVCIHLPDGRNLTWHFSPSDAKHFTGLPLAPADWDGHTTDEKYERLADLPVTEILEQFLHAKRLQDLLAPAPTAEPSDPAPGA